jgi:hypothetical protein
MMHFSDEIIGSAGIRRRVVRGRCANKIKRHVVYSQMSANQLLFCFSSQACIHCRGGGKWVNHIDNRSGLLMAGEAPNQPEQLFCWHYQHSSSVFPGWFTKDDWIKGVTTRN